MTGIARRRASATRRVARHRSFDPRTVGRLESRTWVAYYRREWWTFLRSAIALTHQAFGLAWPATLRGAWLVLRANQLWAPFPDNDPELARAAMERFYRLVQRHHGEPADPVTASRLEVEWWRVHREHQHAPGTENESLISALAALYASVYDVPEPEVRAAAAQRALGMDDSDRWVQEGCDLSSPLITSSRAALVRSYAHLLGAVHGPAGG